jgi:hypothetical protein
MKTLCTIVLTPTGAASSRKITSRFSPTRAATRMGDKASIALRESNRS